MLRYYATLIFLFLNIQLATASDCPEHYYRQTEPVIHTKSSVELCLDRFVVLYDVDNKTPIWSAEFLSKEDVLLSRSIERKDDFHIEKRLPVAGRTKNSDYDSSGYDRGHLTPYRDKSFSVDIDSLANIAPQPPMLNRGVWAHLEDSVRDSVVENGDVFVITGVVIGKENTKTIGNNVPIPTHYFKLVIFPATNTSKAYVAENKNESEIQVWSTDDLELLVGASFGLQ